jgi:hypothetical protein
MLYAPSGQRYASIISRFLWEDCPPFFGIQTKVEMLFRTIFVAEGQQKLSSEQTKTIGEKLAQPSIASSLDADTWMNAKI